MPTVRLGSLPISPPPKRFGKRLGGMATAVSGWSNSFHIECAGGRNNGAGPGRLESLDFVQVLAMCRKRLAVYPCQATVIFEPWKALSSSISLLLPQMWRE